MIAPLLNVTIAGVVWYQGEANVNDAWDYTGGPAGDSALPSYACRFPALIADWRARRDRRGVPVRLRAARVARRRRRAHVRDDALGADRGLRLRAERGDAQRVH